jgi:hypothetical protein
MAFDLGLPYDISKPNLCKHIQRISQMDPNALAKQAMDRQMFRISTTVATPDEFSQGNAAKFVCRNRAVDHMSGRDPYNYNDTDLAFYRDSDDAVWCFISDEFPDLLADQINPITRGPLPDKILQEMKHKQLLAHRAGLPQRNSGNRPLTYLQALQKLKTNDQINNDHSNEIEQAFFETARSYGVGSHSIESLTKAQAQTILNGLNYDVRLEGLTVSHARMTFIRALYDELLSNPSMASIVFDLIKVQRVPINSTY